ncbi:DUF4303 domain-containing protein [Vallitalea okinawensis]|uniref:DUF4303 domain-containing protein n=1 Tax=Vallitalea okinawensis TaxID=2078660 RepID=UPI000CFBE956|nr:DUF4303 domain-containing protein [Vallitalea okinawensis]
MLYKRLLKRNHFQQLEKELKVACLEVIEKLRTSDDNDDIYAFALDVDEDYGTIVIAVNSESLLSARIQEVYPTYTEERINGVSGLKYNTGDFSLTYPADNMSENLKVLSNTYYDVLVNADYSRYEKQIFQYKCKFLETMVSVLDGISGAFSKLNTTDDFIYYVIQHDVSEEDILSLMRRTNSCNRINSIFPEFEGFDSFKLDITSSMSKHEQVKYWIQCYLDFMMEHESQSVRRLHKLKKNRFDVKNEIIDLGEYSIDELLILAERYGRELEHTFEWLIPMKERLKLLRTWTDEEKKIYTSRTIEGELAVDFLMMIKEIGRVDAATTQRLYNLLNDVFQKNREFRRNGLVIPVIARTLHTIDPTKYPEPVIGSSDNKLVNYKEFGLS